MRCADLCASAERWLIGLVSPLGSRRGTSLASSTVTDSWLAVGSIDPAVPADTMFVVKKP
jgi:hypothetical protein